MMRALTILPGVPNSLQLDEVQEPAASEGTILVRTMALGVCGTDREIVAGEYGLAPPGQRKLVLGHESLGRIETAPEDSGFAPGDLVVGVVRRPDPVPCSACAVGEWDMCRNGQYTERGIKGLNGYGAERFRLEPQFAIKVRPELGVLGVLLEPTSIVAKAWDHVQRVGQRSASWTPRTAVITGAGPIGLLAALLAVQRGLAVHVFDRNTRGAKPELVRDLGATYHTDLGELNKIEPDILIECSGAVPVIAAALGRAAPAGIVCLTGVTPSGRKLDIDIGGLNREMVLNNEAVFGTVNANCQHYTMAAEALAKADKNWLARIITRKVPLERWSEALERRPGDIKVIIDFAA